MGIDAGVVEIGGVSNVGQERQELIDRFETISRAQAHTGKIPILLLGEWRGCLRATEKGFEAGKPENLWNVVDIISNMPAKGNRMARGLGMNMLAGHWEELAALMDTKLVSVAASRSLALLMEYGGGVAQQVAAKYYSLVVEPNISQVEGENIDTGWLTTLGTDIMTCLTYRKMAGTWKPEDEEYFKKLWEKFNVKPAKTDDELRNKRYLRESREGWIERSTRQGGKYANNAAEMSLAACGFSHEARREAVAVWNSILIDRSKCMDQNLEMVADLDGAEKGSAAVLNQEFGIVQFGAYTRQLLENQYHQRDEKAGGYVLYLASQADWNASGYSTLSQIGLEELAEVAQKAGYKIRIVEANGVKDHMARLRQVGSRYGKEKVKGLIWTGHSDGMFLTTDTSLLGDPLGVGAVKSGKVEKFLKNVLPDDCPVAIASCHSENIASILSENGGREALGKKKFFNAGDIKMTIDEWGRVHFYLNKV
jgi:hypothetical protein